jgi:hypothetical protein
LPKLYVDVKEAVIMKMKSYLCIVPCLFSIFTLASCSLSQGGAEGGRAIGDEQAQQHCLTYRKYAEITARESRDTLGRDIVRFKCHPLPKDVPPLQSGFYDPKNAYFIEKKPENPWPMPQ